MTCTDRKNAAIKAALEIEGQWAHQVFVQLLEAQRAELQIELEEQDNPTEVWRAQGSIRCLSTLLHSITSMNMR